MNDMDDLDAVGHFTIKDKKSMNWETANAREKIVAAGAHARHVGKLSDGFNNVADDRLGTINRTSIACNKRPNLVEFTASLPCDSGFPHFIRFSSGQPSESSAPRRECDS